MVAELTQVTAAVFKLILHALHRLLHLLNRPLHLFEHGVDRLEHHHNLIHEPADKRRHPKHAECNDDVEDFLSFDHIESCLVVEPLSR